MRVLVSLFKVVVNAANKSDNTVLPNHHSKSRTESFFLKSIQPGKKSLSTPIILKIIIALSREILLIRVVCFN